tara:strand:- start:10980 stop:11846 length:867 start_codon:yes stop_codon:yes gene_type:complete
MAISNQQFETWANQGAVASSKATGDSIKRVVSSYDKFPVGVTYDVYLQGSYKNNTNIYSESDVDVVVELTSTFYNNLSQEQQAFLGLRSAYYGFIEFKNDVIRCLSEYYGKQDINPDNKVVKLAPNSGRRPADILICCTYREYYRVESNAYHDGVYFRTSRTHQNCYSFPKKHYENTVGKNQDCNGNFKSMVRIFKNVNRTLVNRGDIIAKTAPSYFIECLLGNISYNQFQGIYSEMFMNILEYLADNNWDEFKCLNGLRSMWGEGSENWTEEKARRYLVKTVDLWDE